jgi:hypothetical protein
VIPVLNLIEPESCILPYDELAIDAGCTCRRREQRFSDLDRAIALEEVLGDRGLVHRQRGHDRAVTDPRGNRRMYRAESRGQNARRREIQIAPGPGWPESLQGHYFRFRYNALNI